MTKNLNQDAVIKSIIEAIKKIDPEKDRIIKNGYKKISRKILR